MVLQSNVQHQQPVPPFSVHGVPLESVTTLRNMPGTPQRRATLPNDTFPHTPVSPNSPPFFTTSPISDKHAPRLDMKDQQSTLGLPPITPVSPLHSSSIKSTARDCEHVQVVQGLGHQPTDVLHEPTHLSPGRVNLHDGYPISSRGCHNCVHELTSSWQGEPAGTLPTPVSALPRATGR